MKTTRLTVKGMTCGHCKETVEKTLANHPGVRTATVHLDDGAAEVQYEEGRVTPEQLMAAVEDEGYPATIAGNA